MELKFNEEQLINIAAEKICDQFCETERVSERVSQIISQRMNEIFGEKLKTKIDEFLTEEMTKIVQTEIAPVNLWGEKVGEPTTIKNALAERARDFWNQKVNNEGKATSDNYYSKPRHEYLFGKIVNEEFAKAVSQDTVNIVGALKIALKDNMTKTLDDKLNELIKVKIK